jgi:PAP2 superfamily
VGSGTRKNGGVMMLSWSQAAVLAFVLAGFGVLVRPAGRQWLTIATAVCRETSLVLALFSIWQIAGRLSLLQLSGARGHALWIWDAERTFHLPNEASIQRVFLPYPLVIKAFNVYYATMHFPALIIFLIWCFFRHREHYPAVRNTVAILTAACLLIQLIPVAPPRMFTNLGFVDTALRYGQSVYGAVGSGFADQLSAMPSVHVGWAVLIAVFVLQISRSPWRWLVLVHTSLTILIVTVTANHWLLDGIVAVVLLGMAMVAERWSRAAATRLRSLLVPSPIAVAVTVRAGAEA